MLSELLWANNNSVYTDFLNQYVVTIASSFFSVFFSFVHAWKYQSIRGRLFISSPFCVLCKNTLWEILPVVKSTMWAVSICLILARWQTLILLQWLSSSCFYRGGTFWCVAMSNALARPIHNYQYRKTSSISSVISSWWPVPFNL